MAAPVTTWPTTDATAMLAGKGAKTVGQDLFDRFKVAQQSGMTVHCVLSTASASRTNLYLWSYQFPVWLRDNNVVRFGAHVYVTAGTGRFRLRVASTNGTEVSTTTTSSSPGDWLESEVNVPDSSWAGAPQNCIIQGYCSGGGTVHITTERVSMNFRLGD